MSIFSLADNIVPYVSTGVSPLTERTAGSGISTRVRSRSGTGTPLLSASGLECVFRSRSSPDPVLGVILSTSERGRPRKQKPSSQVKLSVTTGLSLTVAQLDKRLHWRWRVRFTSCTPRSKGKKNRLSSKLARALQPLALFPSSAGQ